MGRGQPKTRTGKGKGSATAASTPRNQPGATGPTTHRATSNRRGRRRLRTILGAGTVAVLVIITAVAVFLARTRSVASAALTNPVDLNPATKTLSIGAAAPNFDLASVDGQRISLSSLKGHPVVLEFFAIWCPHCQNEAATLNQIDASYAAKGERTVAILANPYGRDYDTSNGTDLRLADRGDVGWFEATFKVHHATLIDPTFATVNQYGANAYPMIYVIDGSGNVRFVQSGEVSYQTLADVLNRIQ